MSSIKLIALSLPLVLCLSSQLDAVLFLDFETDTEGFFLHETPGELTQTTSVSSTGSGSLAITNESYGWQWTAQNNLDTALISDSLAIDPNAVLSFDVILDASSSNVDWGQINFAANSSIGPGWTQFENLRGDSLDNGVFSFSYTASDLNWATGSTYYQLNFGSNFGNDPGPSFTYFVDNVRLTVVPEPASGVMVVLCCGVLSVARRRVRSST